MCPLYRLCYKTQGHSFFTYYAIIPNQVIGTGRARGRNSNVNRWNLTRLFHNSQHWSSWVIPSYQTSQCKLKITLFLQHLFSSRSWHWYAYISDIIWLIIPPRRWPSPIKASNFPLNLRITLLRSRWSFLPCEMKWENILSELLRSLPATLQSPNFERGNNKWNGQNQRKTS